MPENAVWGTGCTSVRWRYLLHGPGGSVWAEDLGTLQSQVDALLYWGFWARSWRECQLMLGRPQCWAGLISWWICSCQTSTLRGSETMGWKSYLPAGKVTADGISYQNLVMK